MLLAPRAGWPTLLAAALAAMLVATALPEENYAASRPRLAAGQFLIAGRGLLDPNFVATVVLLLHHGEQGAVGVIVNRPSAVPLRTVLPEVAELESRQDRLYLGGPVAADAMIVLVRSSAPSAEATPVIDDVYLVSRAGGLSELLEGGVAEGSLRAFAGHAGWAPGQLEGELARGDWHVRQASADAVFSGEPEKLWQELVRRAELPEV